MRDIRACSGPWKGIWTQGAVRGTMHAFRLRFSGDAISGDGQDLDGPFMMEGTVDPTGTHVDLAKRYWHTGVRYIGTWNGSFIAGESIIGSADDNDRGTFEMWPEGEDFPIGTDARELSNA